MEVRTFSSLTHAAEHPNPPGRVQEQYKDTHMERFLRDRVVVFFAVMVVPPQLCTSQLGVIPTRTSLAASSQNSKESV